MMKLKNILHNVDILEIIGSAEIHINTIQFNSKDITSNDLFIAIKGEKVDGHDYVKEAIDKGAIGVILEYFPDVVHEHITYVKVKKTNSSLSIIALNYYKDLSKQIKIIGVTGTNGKTTIVSLLHQLFNSVGYKSGMLSTINNKIGSTIIPSTHTTPDILSIYNLLSRMIDDKCEYCFMEVSSHALSQGRVSGLDFAGGVFTNITHDHLDYHKSFSAYRDAKKSFFDSLGCKAFAIINQDDKNGVKMCESTEARTFYYSLRTFTDYNCKILESEFEGTLLKINNQQLWIRLVGNFNAYNMLAVYSVAKQFSIKDQDIFKYMSMLIAPEGRFQVIKSDNNIVGIVDYAHTPDALHNVLSVINRINNKKGKVITVVGCGGNRDKKKRPLIANVAFQASSQVIFTSDNPRQEDPDKIIEDMMKGIDESNNQGVLIIKERKQAIRTACKLAGSNDIILIAGKGHEKYQEHKEGKKEFDDLKELKISLKVN